MAVLAADVFRAASIIAQDVDFIRWPLPELAGWLNDGARETVLQKPSASSATVVLPLQAGTWQTIGAGRLALLRIVRNLAAEGPPRVGGRAVRVVSRAILDTQHPDWHDPTVVPYAAVVKHFVVDEQDPTSWWSYPGNDGAGKVEAIVSLAPVPVEPTGNADDIASYAVPIPLPDIYKGVLVDYVLYRAYAKDAAFAGNLQRAAAHYGQFQASLGIKQTVETQLSANAAAGTAAS